MHTKSYRYNKAICLHEMVSLVEIRYSMEVKTVKELAIYIYVYFSFKQFY